MPSETARVNGVPGDPATAFFVELMKHTRAVSSGFFNKMRNDMHIDGNVTGTAIVALAIFAHAWQPRIQGNPQVLSIIGWVVQGLAVIALLACWIQG